MARVKRAAAKTAAPKKKAKKGAPSSTKHRKKAGREGGEMNTADARGSRRCVQTRVSVA